MFFSGSTKKDLLRSRNLVCEKNYGNSARHNKRRILEDLNECAKDKDITIDCCMSPALDSSTYDEFNYILSNLSWSWRKLNRRKLSPEQGSIVLGTTLGSGSGFTKNGRSNYGTNDNIIPKILRQEDKILLKQLWVNMKNLIKDVDPDFTFTSLQVNKNFTGHPHTDKNNQSYQYALSIGEVVGGYLVVSTDEPLSYVAHKTLGRLTKVDGRHTHWVSQHTRRTATTDSGDRFSIVAFSVGGKRTKRLSNKPNNSSNCKTHRVRRDSKIYKSLQPRGRITKYMQE